MKTCCYTSFNYAYLPRARVLVESVRLAHPEWQIYAVLVDELPDAGDSTALDDLFDSVLTLADLDIPRVKSWMFKHNVVEACTAVKGHAMLKLMQSFDKVIYLDPDIAIFHPLTELEDLLDTWSIVLTPHQLEPNHSEMAILDNELTSLRYGIFNLGFIAVRKDEEGLRFAAWWAAHLYRACYDDVANGIFTDQKYCDLVPALFKSVHVHRDPGYNVASWNLSNRRLLVTRSGSIEVNGSPLGFYHFTKIDGDGDIMVKRYAGGNLAVFELWEWYRRRVRSNRLSWIRPGYWKYGQFSNGSPITRRMRLLFRQRSDLQIAFGNPFEASHGGFLDWIRSEEPGLLDDLS